VEPVYDTQLLCEVRAGNMWGGVVDAIDILREAARKTNPSYAAMAADTGTVCNQQNNYAFRRRVSRADAV
jgi:hypothetical protein